MYETTEKNTTVHKYGCQQGSSQKYLDTDKLNYVLHHHQYDGYLLQILREEKD